MEALIKILESLQHTLTELGPWDVLAFAGVFLGAQMMIIPVAPLGLAAGFFFGFGKGWLALMLGCTLGAMLNFIISRKLARAWMQRRLEKNKKLRLIDTAIEHGGWKIVAMLRFVPIPFGLANYAYGLTPIRFTPYILATFFAIIPANSLFVWMGATSHGELDALLGKGRARHPLEYGLLALGIIAAFFVLRYVARLAKSAVEGRSSEKIT